MRNLSKTENETLMPIGGNNLPIDVASVAIELNQAQVDHAIAKMTKQQEEEAAAECVADKENENPVEYTSRPAPAVVADDQPQVSKHKGDVDAKVGSPPAKGEFKIIMHALKKKIEAKHTYKCRVCGARKSSIHRLNNHHKRHHGPQICGICGQVFALALSLNGHMYSHEEQRLQLLL